MHFVVREADEGDESARQAILDSATRELRQVYRRNGPVNRCSPTRTGVFVAVDGSVIAGAAEYVIGDDHLYLQGVAVRRDYRGLGVCRSLVTKAEELARNRRLRAVTLCAIEETGNVAIFERLGFQVRNRVVASDYLSVEGNAVTQVDLVREIT